MADRAGDRDREIAQYRAILTYSPNDPLALNNLAYALAVYRGNPEEALPFAERASTNARRAPELLGGTEILGNYFALGRYHREPLVPYCLDTLAWVQHLLGRHAEAAITIHQARNAQGVQTAEMMWHAAVIYASINDQARASAELEAALKIDPDLANRGDVKQLRHQLAAGR
jgi:tetratricopeptide (TPR) repeat protein